MQTRAAKRREAAKDQPNSSAKRARKGSAGSAGTSHRSEKPEKAASKAKKRPARGPAPAPPATEPEAQPEAPQPPPEAQHHTRDMSRRASRGEQEERVRGPHLHPGHGIAVHHAACIMMMMHPSTPLSGVTQDGAYNRNYTSAGRWGVVRRIGCTWACVRNMLCAMPGMRPFLLGRATHAAPIHSPGRAATRSNPCCLHRDIVLTTHVPPVGDACSALQGLLRKLGAGFEDMLPMGMSSTRIKVGGC
jgi:hypothetical protein